MASIQDVAWSATHYSDASANIITLKRNEVYGGVYGVGGGSTGTGAFVFTNDSSNFLSAPIVTSVNATFTEFDMGHITDSTYGPTVLAVHENDHTRASLYMNGIWSDIDTTSLLPTIPSAVQFGSDCYVITSNNGATQLTTTVQLSWVDGSTEQAVWVRSNTAIGPCHDLMYVPQFIDEYSSPSGPYFLGCGNDLLYLSGNRGTSWSTFNTLALNDNWTAMARQTSGSGNTVVVVSYTGYIYRIPNIESALANGALASSMVADTVVWTGTGALNTQGGWLRVIHAGDAFVAMAQSGALLYCLDGETTWYNVPNALPVGPNWSDIAYQVVVDANGSTPTLLATSSSATTNKVLSGIPVVLPPAPDYIMTPVDMSEYLGAQVFSTQGRVGASVATTQHWLQTLHWKPQEMHNVTSRRVQIRGAAP